MRMFLLTAAIAASTIATSLAAAGAATLKRSHEMSKATVERVAPTGSYAQDFARNFAPFQPSGWFRNANPRLAQIETQLDQVERTINADRRHGLMTAGEARSLREQGKLIRNTAFDTVKQNHGSIPDASYNALLGRVAGLNQTIQMDTQHG